ncbi:MAG: SDR family NAD(P)-dependent oxidoreductase [Bacteroidetes bacterium]|nr:SDR family NAD(P)-dependent oxidoreductase [Bacteroidota bacterium]
MQLKDKTILITGGSSGIGLESIKHFLTEGMKVIICGRDGLKLQLAKSKFPSIATISCDITKEEDVSLMHQLVMSSGGIDILYHNAGVVSVNSLVEKTAITIATNEMETNYLSAVRLTSLFLPELAKRKEAAFVFTTSAVAYLPAAFIPTYSASKAALHSYVLSLRYQLRELYKNISVIELIPPTVDTEATKIFTSAKVSAERVAKDVVNGLKNNRSTIHVSIAKSFSYLHRFFSSLAFSIVNPKNPIR